MSERQAADAVLVQLQVVCAALAGAALVYFLVAWLLLAVVLDPAGVGGLPAPVPGVLAVFAAATLVAAPVVERGLLQRGGGSVPDAAGYRAAKLLGFALRETVAIVGLVLALVTGRAAWSGLLSLAALVAMALAWPRAADLEPRPGGAPGGPGSIDPD
jgi:hypothetical protein